MTITKIYDTKTSDLALSEGAKKFAAIFREDEYAVALLADGGLVAGTEREVASFYYKEHYNILYNMVHDEDKPVSFLYDVNVSEEELGSRRSYVTNVYTDIGQIANFGKINTLLDFANKIDQNYKKVAEKYRPNCAHFLKLEVIKTENYLNDVKNFGLAEIGIKDFINKITKIIEGK